MTMATSLKSSRRAYLASKCLDLEEPVHDVADMAKIANILMERFRDEMAASIKAGWSKEFLLVQLDELGKPAAFAVDQVHSIANRLRDIYTESEPV